MPQGKGTYGNQVGRPSKNKTMANIIKQIFCNENERVKKTNY